VAERRRKGAPTLTSRPNFDIDRIRNLASPEIR
jgi:hypothetical protein